MKKLSLLLFAICMSGASVFAGLNPFVYDLSTSWNQDTKVLNVQFKLNAEPNFDSNKGGRGVQIYLVDASNNEYYIKGPSQSELQAQSRNGGSSTGTLLHPPYSYNFNIDLSSGMTVDATPKNIPMNQPLRVAVVVSGISSSNRQPEASTLWQGYDRLYSVHGITIDTVKTSPTFGRVFATEGKTHTNSNYISKDKGVGVYKFNPGVKYEANWNGGTNSDPIRVRLSEDGRLFVCSFKSNAPNDVWEINKTTGAWSSFVSRHSSYGDVIGMDTKGKGNDLKVLLCYLNKTNPSLDIYEYSQKDQSLTYLTRQNITTEEKTYLMENWTVSIAYGNQDNDIWLSYEHNYQEPSQLKNVRKINGNWTSTKYDPVLENTSSGSNTTGGAAGILVHGNLLVKAAVRSSDNKTFLHFWTISTDNTTGKAVLTKKYDPLQIFVPLSNGGYCVWINDMAIDHVNNIYMSTAWYARLNVAALPYTGSDRLETRNTFEYSTPVPNILATDLCCTPHEKQAKYIFSFNVNTKPEGAEIRFYTTEAAMLADTKDNEAYIKYNNHDKCAYYYRFPTGACKQGTMSVELGILGHPANEKNLSTDMKLPAGKLYWNVYLKTRKSNAFAPIYIQPLTDANDVRTHYRLHATVDNNPDNDGFGHIYAIDYKLVKTDATMKDNLCKLMRYTIGDAGVDDNSDAIESSTRYALIDILSTDEMVQPRRPAVAPDGMVYLTDYGDYKYNGVDFTSKGTGPNEFIDGGIWVFNPNDPYKDAGKTAAKLSRFYEEDETVSDAYFYHDGSNLKLYKTNTYEEYSHHGQDNSKPNDNYQASAWQKNGYRIYTMGYNQDGTIKHSAKLTDGPVTAFIMQDGTGKVGGDANGSISMRVTENGVWFCQNRKGTYTDKNKPDNRENVAIMFYNNSGQRTFQSHIFDNGILSQSTTAIMQSTPGAGMTISPDERYLYVVNHECNILRFTINGTTTPTLNSAVKYVNRAKFNDPNEPNEGISTLNFDYAGNLIATVDQDYPCDASEKSRIVIFTVPYPDRDNARSIPASKSQREIPERLAYTEAKDITETTIAKKPALVDFYRPMPNTSYSTICLPFDLDITSLPENNPYKQADVRAFESAEVSEVGGEKMLFLNFSAAPVTSLLANTPYIIKPSVRVPGIVELPAKNWVANINQLTPGSDYDNFDVDNDGQDDNSITFTGVIPKQDIVVEPGKTLILVAENRLAEMEPDAGKTIDSKPAGEILGFRGYFTLGAPLPQGVQAIIRNKDNTLTGLVDVNGQKINIQKYLREGRIFIRVNDTLYTIDGQKVL